MSARAALPSQDRMIRCRTLVSIARTIELTTTPLQLAQSRAIASDAPEVDADGRARQNALGQFFTPEPVAEFMASLFEARWESVRLLDAGAGAGSLTAALVRRLCRQSRRPREISVAAYEIDASVLGSLRATLDGCERQCDREGIRFTAIVEHADFIEALSPAIHGDLFGASAPHFNAAIVNPPYRKIRSNSPARLWLRSAGIEASNLYTGFLSLITHLLDDDGEMVAITPRSFCNGPYFRPFREDFLSRMSLRQLHVFESRSAAFGGDDVLQENIIFRVVKSDRKPEQVVISSSSGEPGTRVTERLVPFREVVSLHDPQQFIHLAANESQAKARKAMTRLTTTLAELGLSVSTGRVVDFRARPFLRKQPGINTVPLIYPGHFNGVYVHWPKSASRKPNAIVNDAQTASLLVPAETYVLVKRFTSKEERRRVVACIYDPSRIAASVVGFENHLNYFHVKGRGMSMDVAKGLAAFLNSTPLDVYFRQFNGHTQVNATDLRSLRYPTREQLVLLGCGVQEAPPTQQQLDDLLEDIFDVG